MDGTHCGTSFGTSRCHFDAGPFGQPPNMTSLMLRTAEPNPTLPVLQKSREPHGPSPCLRTQPAPPPLAPPACWALGDLRTPSPLAQRRGTWRRANSLRAPGAKGELLTNGAANAISKRPELSVRWRSMSRSVHRVCCVCHACCSSKCVGDGRESGREGGRKGERKEGRE